ncbi:MAG: glycosyltransferase family 4 protein [Thermodesulfobacteriota bacterium]
MRISYFNYHYDVEGIGIGAATQVRAIAAALTRGGHQVDLQFRAAKKPGENKQYGGLKEFGWARRYGHIPKIFLRNFSLLPRELQLLEAFRPDVLLTVCSYVNFSALLAAQLRRLPFVLFIEAPLEYEYRLFFPQYYRYPLLGRWLEGLQVRRARQVISISEILKGYLMRYGPPAHKIHVVPNGVDHLAFKPQEPDQELLSRWGLKDRLVIGYIGSFEFLGDIPLFLASAKRICAAHSRAVFFMVGEGRHREEVSQGAAEFGLKDRFLFPGRIPHAQAPRYLSLMDLVISPYREDYLFYGSSMKLLEYMAAGKVVLAPALGQIKELVVDGYNGMLYEPGEPGALELKLQELIDSGRLPQMGLNARKTIERNWTWDLQAARITQVLEMALKP